MATPTPAPTQPPPRSPSPGAHAAFLHANSDAYEWLVERARAMDPRKDAETVLRRVASAASFASLFHPGRFADGAIENLAFEIGATLADLGPGDGRFAPPPVKKEGRRRVLHVARNVALGGHAPLMLHWMQRDTTSCHSLALVNQRADVTTPWPETVQQSGGSLVVLPPGSHLEKARRLRDVARRSADMVVWHVIDADVVPIVALAVQDCPPVALVDHCDHHFWLGGSVADMLVNLRSVGSEHTAARRYVPRNSVIPIPLTEPGGGISRRDARRALGIGEDEIVLLSVGRERKYRPCGSYDFVATSHKILEREPRAHLYVLGASVAGMAPHLRHPVPDRLHFMGRVEGPPLALYRAAADVYLESFPYGSQTALLEAALSGLPVVPAYAPLCALLVAHDAALAEVLVNPRDEGEYVERVSSLVRERELRITLGRELRERLLVDHVDEGWLGRLAAVQQEMDGLAHRPRPIPESPRCMTEADVGLSLFNVAADGRTSSTAPTGDAAVAALRHRAFVSKYVGDYAAARRSAWHAVRADPRQLASWRLLGVALLGQGGRFLRRRLRASAR